MFSALFTTIISAVTSVLAIVLPIIAASTGRSALQKDMDLYKQWTEIIKSETDASGEMAQTEGDSSGQGDQSLAVQKATPDLLTDTALKKFRSHIDFRLMVRSRNRALSPVVFGAILIALFAAYIVWQVVGYDGDITDDLIRSIVFLTLILLVIGVFILMNIHKIKAADVLWDEIHNIDA